MNTCALVYRRVSTDHQDNSLQVQEHLNDQYCLRLGIHVAGTFADDDVSGSIPFADRPGSGDLTRRLILGDITDVITSKQDRLGRDTLDIIATVRRIWEQGITPHFTSEGGALPRTPQNELLLEIKAATAQYERNLIRERTTAVLRHKRSRGELTGTVPYGFDCRYNFANGHALDSAVALTAGQLAPLIVTHGALLKKVLVPNPVEQDWLRRIADWRASSLSYKAIADHLNAAGVLSKRGGRWQCGQVDSLLHSGSATEFLRSRFTA